MTRRRIDRGLLLASFVIALGLVALAWGAMVGFRGSRAEPLPTGVERVDPVPDSIQVLPQSSVFVDLEIGYTGVLVIDGSEIETVDLDQIGSLAVEPGQQVDIPPVTIFEPGNATLTFTPRRGAAIEQFAAGLHEVTLIYWRLDEGRGRASSFTWSFNVF